MDYSRCRWENVDIRKIAIDVAYDATEEVLEIDVTDAGGRAVRREDRPGKIQRAIEEALLDFHARLRIESERLEDSVRRLKRPLVPRPGQTSEGSPSQ